MEKLHTINIGDSLGKEFLVEDEHAAAHIGSGSMKVLATPMMIAYIEITARNLLDMYLPEGFSSVGTAVDVHHLAPTALGKTVRAFVEIIAVEDKKVRLEVSAWDGEIKIGTGTHDRYLIEVANFLEKLNEDRKQG